MAFSLVTLLFATSCSLKPKGDGQFVTVRFSKGSSQKLSRQLSGTQYSDTKSLTFSDFSCFGIQVSGAGVLGDPRLGCPGQGGMIAGMIPSSGGDLELLVPAGAQRTVRVFALKSSVSCPSIDSLAALPPETRYSGLELPYEIGSTTLDLFHDVDVSIQAKFDPAAPVAAFPATCWGNVNGATGHSGLGLGGRPFFVSGNVQSAPGNCAIGASHPCLRANLNLDVGQVAGGVAAPSPGNGRYPLHFGQAATEPEQGL